jgi:Poly A polymerase head domain.
MFEPPAFAISIIEKIESAGYEAYFVGGCVRDMLLSRNPSDWDIASSALPQDIISIFPKTVPTGIKYGTVTVITDEGKAEVTTFRSESSYSDHRRPDGVSFCSNIENDLSRRDFTVNAMAYSPRRGFIDPFGGRLDIKNKKFVL